MPNITVRNIPVEVHDLIKLRARKNNRSTEAEIRSILNTIAEKEAGNGFGQFLRSFFQGVEGVELGELRDQAPLHGVNFE